MVRRKLCACGLTLTYKNQENELRRIEQAVQDIEPGLVVSQLPVIEGQG